MNQQLQDFARSELINGLQKLSEGSQNLFRRMYGQPSDTLEHVVANMPEEKLDWAMEQLRRSIDKLRASTDLSNIEATP
jgi:hypothetical protein